MVRWDRAAALRVLFLGGLRGPLRCFWGFAAAAGLLAGGVFGSAAGGRSGRGLAGVWDFEGAPGLFARDASGHGLDGRLLGAEIARGRFGQALYCSGRDSYLRIPGPEGLDGAEAFSLMVWVLWEGTGDYPNIVTGGRWSPGGFLLFVNRKACSFRLGRPGVRATAAGSLWRETGVTLLNPVPLRRWVHLAVTFQRPLLTGYVDGRRVGSVHWDYPLGFSGDIVVGKWGGSICHKGLIDHLCIFRRALSAGEIAADYRATKAGRDSPAYTVLRAAPPRRVFRVRTAAGVLDIDAAARVCRLEDRTSGRDLLAGPRLPMAEIVVRGRRIPAVGCRASGDRLALRFWRSRVQVRLRIEGRGDYFRISIDRVRFAAGVEQLCFFQAAVAPRRYRSIMAGLVSDAETGVCVRTLNLATEVRISGTPPVFGAETCAEYGLAEGRVCLAVGSRARIRRALKHAAEAEGAPVSSVGGPWSMDAPANHGSYLFARVSEQTVGSWIALARRGGFSCIHFSGWWRTLGHYQPNPRLFPHGLAGMKACVHKIHAAGLRAGMHTLTGCISPGDAWATPRPDPRLAADAVYTLAEPLGPAGRELRVRERPEAHDVVWTYSSNGNVLRLGAELVRYHAIRREKPYAFLQLERGAFGTRIGPHAAGSRADHLRQHYRAFYPDEKSSLVGELADRIAGVYNTCGMDQIYQDGAEGMGSRHAIAVMRRAIFTRLKRPALVESSCGGQHNWWFHSRLGAWDHARWGFKRFHDAHCALAEQYRKAALLEPQLGWWDFVGPSRWGRGQFPDEVEYFAGKNLALDAAMSLQGVRIDGHPANARQLEYVTLLGWYEHLRRARYFDAATRARLRGPGREFRLRQDARGRWRFRPAFYRKHRIEVARDRSSRWSVVNPFGEQRFRFRLEALYGAAGGGAPAGREFLDGSPATLGGAWPIRSSAPGVQFQAALVEGKGAPGNGKAVLCLRARNQGAPRDGAWCRVGRRFKPYLDIRGNDALAVWVHGDGKGEVINFQLRTPREYQTAYSDHCFVIDFKGWRRIELPFRERSAGAYSAYRWPYRAGYSIIYRRPLDRGHVSALNIYLNNLPRGQAVEVKVASLRAVPLRALAFRDPRFTLNGESLRLPLALNSGEYIEWDEQGIEHFDARGALLERLPTPAVPPRLRPGANQLEFSATALTPGLIRAQVTVIGLGSPFGARNPARVVDWRLLCSEYCRPRVLLAQDGRDNAWEIRCRRDTARYTFEIAVDRIGPPHAAYERGPAMMLEPCEDPGRFEPSPANRYVQYVYDGVNRGIPARPGVTQALETVRPEGERGPVCFAYSAASRRRDGAGWCAKGRRFDPPLDLSHTAGIGFRIFGDGQGEIFKLQLRDTGGKWYDMATRIDFVGWKTVEFAWNHPDLDRSRIRYMIFFFNAIPAGAHLRCLIDDIKGFQKTAAVLRTPQVQIGDSVLTFPCVLHEGERLAYGPGRCEIRGPAGARKVAAPAHPVRLHAGANPVRLRFAPGGPRRFFVRVNWVKLYPPEPDPSG